MQILTFLNGDTMPILGLGTWKSGKGEVYSAIREAIRIGYRHIDCATIYGNEKEIGQALNDALSSGDVKREDLWITSKLWNDSHAKDDVVPAIKRTLSSLQLDYLDLFLVHWPMAFNTVAKAEDEGTRYPNQERFPLNGTWSGMEECKHHGLAKHIGLSNFSVKKINDILESASIKPEMNQIELHPYLIQEKLVNHCHNHQIHVTAYAPLGSRDRPVALIKAGEPNLLDNPTIKDIGLRRSMTPAQVLIKSTIDRGIAVIPKSVNPARLAENWASLNFILRSEDLAAIQGIDRHARFVDGCVWTGDDSPFTQKTLWDE